MNPLDVEINSKKSSIINENIPLLNSKSSANNADKSISGRSF
jgi:hypothetical protein